jgi:predicted anti-sigma-YlaC factor YlaD
MNSCFRVKNLLSAYLDRELTGEEMLLVRDHVGQCAECSAEFEELRWVKSSLLTMPMVEPSDDLLDRVKGAVFADVAPVPVAETRRKSIATIGMAAAMLFLVFAVMRWVEVQGQSPIVAGDQSDFAQGQDTVVDMRGSYSPGSPVMLVSAPE